MRLASALLLLPLAGAAQAADWPQGSWCEVQRQDKDGASPVTVEYRLGADGALSRGEDGRVRTIASAVLGQPDLPASLAKRLVALEERAR